MRFNDCVFTLRDAQVFSITFRQISHTVHQDRINCNISFQGRNIFTANISSIYISEMPFIWNTIFQSVDSKYSVLMEPYKWFHQHIFGAMFSQCTCVQSCHLNLVSYFRLYNNSWVPICSWEAKRRAVLPLLPFEEEKCLPLDRVVGVTMLGMLSHMDN